MTRPGVINADAQRFASVLRATVHTRHGLLTSFTEHAACTAAPDLFVFTAASVEGSYFRNNSRARVQDAGKNGSGASFDRQVAAWATVGEAIERYSAFIYDPHSLVLCRADELDRTPISLSNCILFGESQYQVPGFPFFRADPAAPRNWVGATMLHDGRETYMPANMAFLGMRLSAPEESISQNASTGLSCASTRSGAVESGLCEVIERDAFAAMWQMKYSPPRLNVGDNDLGRLSPSARRALRGVNGTRIFLWSIGTDIGVPTVLAMAENEVAQMRAFGACSALTVPRAIEKATVEALHGLVWGDQQRRQAPDLEQIVTPTDHFRYHVHGPRSADLAFLFESDRVVQSCELAQNHVQNLASLAAHLDSMGYPTTVVDLTTADVRQLGLHVVRVLAPGLHPLLFGYRMVTLDTRRLERIVRFWQLPCVPAPNMAPHPFP